MDQIQNYGLSNPFAPSTPHRRSNSASSFTSNHFPLQSNSSGLDSVLLESSIPGGSKRIEELSDGLATLDMNLRRLNNVHNSLSEFNESFSAFLHCIKMNAWCVEFSEAPSTEAFSQERDDEEEEQQEQQIDIQQVQQAGDFSNYDDYSDMTFMTVIEEKPLGRSTNGISGNNLNNSNPKRVIPAATPSNRLPQSSTNSNNSAGKSRIPRPSIRPTNKSASTATATQRRVWR